MTEIYKTGNCEFYKRCKNTAYKIKGICEYSDIREACQWKKSFKESDELNILTGENQSLNPLGDTLSEYYFWEGITVDLSN